MWDQRIKFDLGMWFAFFVFFAALLPLGCGLDFTNSKKKLLFLSEKVWKKEDLYTIRNIEILVPPKTTKQNKRSASKATAQNKTAPSTYDDK